MVYKNMSGRTMTFYGVEFKPGDVHRVPGAINAEGFVQTKNTIIKPAVTSTTSKPTRKGRSKLIKEEEVDG